MCYERQMVKDGRHKKRYSPSALVRRAGAATTVFMTDAVRAPNPQQVMDALPTGSIVIVRDYDHPNRTDIAHQVAESARALSHQLLVAADLSLAHAIKAHGLHMPEYMLTNRTLIHTARASGLAVSAACHGRRALRQAEAAGVDYALVSPVFETSSHVGAPTLGVHRLARLIDGAKVPVIALGGVNVKSAGHLRSLGLYGIAGISGLT